MRRQVEGQPPEPSGVVEPVGQLFSFAQIGEDPRQLAQLIERVPQLESKVDPLLEGRARFWEVFERGQRSFKESRRLPAGRAAEGVSTALAEIG